MTLKTILMELREAAEDLKAAQRLQTITDTITDNRAIRRRAQERLKGVIETLNQKQFAFQDKEENTRH